MGTRRYSRYEEPGFQPFYCGNPVTGATDKKVVNAAVATYAETRRDIISISANVDSIVPVEYLREDYIGEHFIAIPIRNRIIFGKRGGGDKFTVWLRYELTSDGSGANKCYMNVWFGSQYKKIALTQTSPTWAYALVELGDLFQPDLVREANIYFTTDGTNTVKVHAVCVYQHEDFSTPAWVDISGANCKLGTEDWPHSAYSMKLMTDAVKSVRGKRTIRSNIFNHWYRNYVKTGSSYGGSNDDLGRYVFVKRRGVSQMILHCCCQSNDGSNAFTLRAEITSTANPIAAQTLNYTGTTDPMWDSFTFTFTGTDVGAEVECELLLDAKDNSHGMTMYVPGVCLVEKHLGSAVSHVVPDTNNALAGTIQGASEWDNLKDSMVHLWEHGGVAIALADWRFGEEAHSYDDRLLLNKDALDKSHHGGGSGDGTVAVRAICFPSTGSSRYHLTMGFLTTSGETETKTIEFQLSDSMTNGTYDEIGPGSDRNIDFLEANEDDLRVIACDFDINSADWETPPGELGPADVPLQLWMAAFSTGVAEYVKPKWLTIEEIALNEGEFP